MLLKIAYSKNRRLHLRFKVTPINICNFVCESLVLHIFSEWSLKTLTSKTKSTWIRFSKVDFCKNLTCNLNVYVRFSDKCMCRQCRRQYISMLLWIFGLKKDFVKGEALPLPFICPNLDPPLGISGQNRYENGSIPSKAFCLWSSLWLLLALPWIHPRADLIKA